MMMHSQPSIDHCQSQRESLSAGLAKCAHIINNWLASQSSSRCARRLKTSDINDMVTNLHRLSIIHTAIETLDRPDCEVQEVFQSLAAAMGKPKSAKPKTAKPKPEPQPVKTKSTPISPTRQAHDRIDEVLKQLAEHTRSSG